MGRAKQNKLAYVVTHIDPYSDELFGEVDGVFSDFGSAFEFAEKVAGDVEIKQFEINNSDICPNTVYHRWWNL